MTVVETQMLPAMRRRRICVRAPWSAHLICNVQVDVDDGTFSTAARLQCSGLHRHTVCLALFDDDDYDYHEQHER
jgi:hypothetical protein